MAVHLENPRAEALLNELAEETHQSLTEAATAAFEEKLVRLYAERTARRRTTLVALEALIEEARHGATLDARPLKVITDEAWGDEFPDSSRNAADDLARTDIERA